MTPEEAARHDAPTLPDDDAPPARWWVVGWVLVGCIGWLAVGSLVVLAVRRFWE
jgi:hypothetical protein